MGSTLSEELVYDSQGQLLTQSLDEYLLPSLYEAPIVETVILEYPVKSNPLCIKGSGEGGVAGVPAAVANAVADALGIDNLSKLPLNPANVLRMLATHELERGKARD
jgi:carbon-monoxide dehydrogenase large subunit